MTEWLMLPIGREVFLTIFYLGCSCTLKMKLKGETRKPQTSSWTVCRRFAGLDSSWKCKSTDPISLPSSPGIIFDMEYFMIVRFESHYRMIIEIDSMLSLMF